MSSNPTKLMPSDLAALMCARICHDLISPVGALGSAIEVLNDPANADMHEDAMDLVRLSATQASAKLQFLRLAFGAGTSAPGQIGKTNIMELVEGVYGGGKVEINWGSFLDELGKVQARLVLNMVMMAMPTIPRGGVLHLSAEHQDGLTLKAVATGTRARLDPVVTRTLAGQAPEDGFDGRSIQPFYSGLIVRELQGKITAVLEDETVTITATLPSA